MNNQEIEENDELNQANIELIKMLLPSFHSQLDDAGEIDLFTQPDALLDLFDHELDGIYLLGVDKVTGEVIRVSAGSGDSPASTWIKENEAAFQRDARAFLAADLIPVQCWSVNGFLAAFRLLPLF